MASDDQNVLLILSDEHSYRCFGHLDPDGIGEPVDTPAFDDLAASSAVFEQTYCQVPLCGPSRMCMLTGQEAARCGAWRNKSVLKPDAPTLPEQLSEAGYETCLVGKMHLGGNRQFAGFDHRPYGDLTGQAGHQDDPPLESERGEGRAARIDNAGVTGIPESMLQEEIVARESISFLREHEHTNQRQPWFLCASFSRPHFPLTAPRRHFEKYWDSETEEPTDRVTEPKVGREGDTADHPMTRAIAERHGSADISEEDLLRVRAGYFACVSYLDQVIGDLLATLEREGFLENTTVIYASDHGELAGEHGLLYKRTWHEAATRVPFFIQTPAHRAGERPATRYETPVSLADLFPTVCGLTGIDTPEDLDGVDLSGAIETGTEPDRGPVFCDYLVPADEMPGHADGTEFRIVRDGQYKYIAFRDAPDACFDLAADPLEKRNLLKADGEAGSEDVVERLRQFVDETMDFDAVADRRESRASQHAEYPLEGPEATSGNAYHLPDGRIVDADTPLYAPVELVEDPPTAYGDWPRKNAEE